MSKLKVVEVFLTLFAGGVATSFAEYHFKYNLYETLVGLVNKIRGKKVVAK